MMYIYAFKNEIYIIYICVCVHVCVVPPLCKIPGSVTGCDEGMLPE